MERTRRLYGICSWVERPVLLLPPLSLPLLVEEVPAKCQNVKISNHDRMPVNFDVLTGWVTAASHRTLHQNPYLPPALPYHPKQPFSILPLLSFTFSLPHRLHHRCDGIGQSSVLGRHRRNGLRHGLWPVLLPQAAAWTRKGF